MAVLRKVRLGREMLKIMKDGKKNHQQGSAEKSKVGKKMLKFMKDGKKSYQQGSAEKSKVGKRNAQGHEGRKDELPTRQC